MIVQTNKVTHWTMLVGMYEPRFYRTNPAPVLGPEFMFDFWIGAGYGWFIGGWESYLHLGEEVSKELFEERMRYG